MTVRNRHASTKTRMDGIRPTDAGGDSHALERIAADWLARRDGGAWTPADDDALARWLDADARHRVAFLRLQAAWAESDRLQALGAGWHGHGPPPRGYWSAPPTLRPRASQRRPTRAHWLPRAMAALMLVACAIGASIGWRSWTHVDASSYGTALGEVRTQPLADGSQAILASDSGIDVRLSRRQRHVALTRGEAIFDVAKDAGRPFVVDAGTRRVVAVGTRFSVRRDRNDLRVVVTEGTVRLESATEPGRPSALLPAGSIALVRTDGVLVRTLALDDAEHLLDWDEGLLAFHDTPLDEAVAEFNRYNARKLVVADAAAGALRIGGSFRWDNQEGFVRLLQAGFPVRAEYTDNRIVLRSR
ncbi:MAG: FecR domain-containing protein [Thermomonas sp.]|uniref:FecR family protein n=1 Tax=Thermomonas sp. TaxID=1971895 RepID=UPI0039E3D54A